VSPSVAEAILVNFLFWSGLAIGAVVFAAMLELTDAHWARPLRPIAERLCRFLPISLAAYIVLSALGQTFHWRDAAVLAVTYLAAFWFVWAPRPRTAIVLLVVYAIGFSALAIDVLMSLEPGWVSTLFPAYAFSANVYGGIAAVAAFAAVALPDDQFVRIARDLAVVLVGFALVWMYFTWTQFLVIWYGNLPADTGYVIKRLSGGWLTVAWIVFGSRCALPVVVLLMRPGRSRIPFTATSAVVAIGFWLECWLLVAPDSPMVPPATTIVAVTIAFAALFAGATLWPWWIVATNAATEAQRHGA
jgi:hypothetical protein